MQALEQILPTNTLTEWLAAFGIALGTLASF